MISNLKQYIEELIAKDELWRFYKSKEWLALKKKVLEKYNYECQECKRNGIVTRYDVDAEGKKTLISTVHHVQFVRRHPELALSEWFEYRGELKRNLIPVCKACHNKLHPEKQKNKRTFFNEERW